MEKLRMYKIREEDGTVQATIIAETIEEALELYRLREQGDRSRSRSTIEIHVRHGYEILDNDDIIIGAAFYLTIKTNDAKNVFDYFETIDDVGPIKKGVY